MRVQRHSFMTTLTTVPTALTSPLPGSTFPRSRGPSKWPPPTTAVTRVPCGTAPIF